MTCAVWAVLADLTGLDASCSVLERLAGAGRITLSGDLEKIP